MELPIKSNFREGLNVLEYFIGARGSRKTLSDTALKTADSGYLTRRLVDVSQEVIVREKDCGTTEGIWVYDLVDGDEVIEKLEDRLPGRTLASDVVVNGEVIAKAGDLLTANDAKKIADTGVEKVHVRSILRCNCRHGICAKCYGTDLATGKLVAAGEAVGIVAAQSIGEPGTQLTMRTFHTGGIAGSDITQGLPRVEEIFEARRPKKTATIAEFSGMVRIQDAKRSRNVIITGDDGEDHVYPIPYGTKVLPQDGSYIMRGELITEGNLAPADIARVQGLEAAYDYITREVQRVYKSQDIKINDKHIEVIARQMTRKVRIDESGDTDLLYGSIVDIMEFNDENKKIQDRIDAGERTLRLAECTPILLGITKTALQTESFLSAASFQETTKVLTEAAIKGKVDHLIGLKENVIIGKLIPAGTGLQKYRDIEVKKVEAPEEEEAAETAAV
jgi:DNA-directed RNA polymerase subunit beta'